MFVFELVGEDDAFSAYEAAAVADGIHRVAPGIALATSLSPFVEQLAYTHRIGELVARTGGKVDAATEALREATLQPDGPAAVRARSIRGTAVDTRAVERALGSVLVENGYEIDLESPDVELRVVFTGDHAFLSWLVTETGDDFSARRPTDRPFFQPGSMSPRFARALVNIAGGRPGTRLLDPMCGTGGVLIEGGRIGVRGVGIDAQAHMVAGTRRNCEALAGEHLPAVLVGDARALPLADNVFDTVVFDAPYGRQSRIGGEDASSLIGGALAEARRVSNRAVVVADHSIQALARAEGWIVRAQFARRVHRSLTRHVHDLRHAS